MGMAVNMFLSYGLLLRRRTFLLHLEEKDPVGERRHGDPQASVFSHQVPPHQQHLSQRHQTRKLHAKKC